MADTPRRQVVRAKQKPSPDGKRKFVRYSRKLARRIVEQIAEGEIWYRICNRGGLPSYQSLYRWMNTYPDFGADIAQAKVMAADYKADKALVVAEATTAATVSADRLKVSTLLWHAARHAPHIYGSAAQVRAQVRRRPLEFEIKQFENYADASGATYVREAMDEDDA